jgi:hypothetical protein
MTKEEAKTKWCPMVRITTVGGGSTNRDELMVGKTGDLVNCIASDCMMWRQLPLEKWVWDEDGHKRPSGYCGLGGKP